MPRLWRRPHVSAWGVDTSARSLGPFSPQSRAHARRKPEEGGGALPHAPIRVRSPRAHHVAPAANREAPRATCTCACTSLPRPGRCRVLPCPCSLTAWFPHGYARGLGAAGGRCVRGAPAYAARPAVSPESGGRDSQVGVQTPTHPARGFPSRLASGLVFSSVGPATGDVTRSDNPPRSVPRRATPCSSACGRVSAARAAHTVVFPRAAWHVPAWCPRGPEQL
ncbi:hypothetical protein PAHAL_9G532400 [Panicum hallii]|uniref:Uncharacterized protein n=1 Tax=Panicum hallii TaxID=206008 RepID=A0A2T8I5K8_9POAL|nr:hypothetical protein PAHAL_9G532400 [Panicum hallii]